MKIKEDFKIEYENGNPIIPCLEEGPHLIFLIPCPYCGRKHVHGSCGGGGRGGGHREAHCPDILSGKRRESVGRPPGSERGYILRVVEIRSTPKRDRYSLIFG